MSTGLLTYGSLFSGGGIGQAMLKSKVDFNFAVEYDKAIAGVYDLNYGSDNHKCLVKRVQDIVQTDVCEVDILQASPVCKKFSVALSGKGIEGEEEISQAVAICRVIGWSNPKYFILENVRGYVKSKSFGIINNHLLKLGYKVQMRIVNAANYGVPQTRIRLILVASRADVDYYDWPLETHHNGLPIQDLWSSKTTWVGWYEAIEDLIPTLPSSKFADWQLDRLPSNVTNSLFMPSQNTSQKWGKGYRDIQEPSHTITTINSNSGMPKVFIVEKDLVTRKPFLMDCQSGGAYETPDTRGLMIRYAEQPCYTLVASLNCKPARVWLSLNKVAQLDTRALARLQSIPDDYRFSGTNEVDRTTIGNGVPSLLEYKLIEPMFN